MKIWHWVVFGVLFVTMSAVPFIVYGVGAYIVLHFIHKFW